MNTKILRPQLRFKEFTQAWNECVFGELIIHKGGTALESHVSSIGTHKFISIGNYSADGYYIDNGQRISINEKTKERLVKKNDLVMVLNDKTASGNMIGSTILISEDDSFVYNQRSERISAKENLNPTYAWQYLNSFLFRRAVYSVSQGGTQIYVNFPSVKKLIVKYPSLNEQLKIARFLSLIDNKINLLKKKYSLLKEYKHGVMQKLFSQEIRFKDISDNNFPDWTTERIDYFVERTTDPVNVQPDKTYRQIGVRSHGKGIFHKGEIKGRELGNKRVFWIHPNAFVVNIVFAWEHAVAKTSDSETGFIASHRFPMFIPRLNRIDLRFFTIFFLTKRGKHLLALASPGGAGRNKTLGQGNFAELKVSFPSIEEQIKIADVYEALDKKVRLVEKQIEQIKTFKKGLLQQMFV